MNSTKNMYKGEKDDVKVDFRKMIQEMYPDYIHHIGQYGIRRRRTSILRTSLMKKISGSI